MEQMRQKIASINTLATILLSNNFRVVLSVISSSISVEEEISRQSSEDLANAELDGHVLRVSRSVAKGT
jgi:hypothetical protein